MHALRDALRAHPRAIAILGTRPVTGRELFALLDRMLGVLIAAGMPADADTADLLDVLVTYTIGHVLVTYTIDHVLAEVGEPMGAGSAPTLHQTLSGQAYPHLAAVLDSGWAFDPDAQASTTEGWMPYSPAGSTRSKSAVWPRVLTGRPIRSVRTRSRPPRPVSSTTSGRRTRQLRSRAWQSR